MPDPRVYSVSELIRQLNLDLYRYNATGDATNLTNFSGPVNIVDVTSYAGDVYFTTILGSVGLYKYDGASVTQVAAMPVPADANSYGYSESFGGGLVVFSGQQAPVITDARDLVGVVAGGSTTLAASLAVSDIDSANLTGDQQRLRFRRYAGLHLGAWHHRFVQ